MEYRIQIARKKGDYFEMVQDRKIDNQYIISDETWSGAFYTYQQESETLVRYNGLPPNLKLTTVIHDNCFITFVFINSPKEKLCIES